MGVVECIWSRGPRDLPRVVVERQGGRTRYAHGLGRALAGSTVQGVAETATLSRYLVSRGGSSLTVSFAVEADGRFLAVALASMVAKYVRELLMQRLNRFFGGQMTGLKPTAGYFTDGRRYGTEITPVIQRLHLASNDLVRTV